MHKLKTIIICAVIIGMVILFAAYRNDNHTDWLSEYGVHIDNRTMDIEFSSVDAGRDGVFYYVVKMDRKEKDGIQADWNEMPLSEGERHDYDSGFQFLKHAGKDIPIEYVPDLDSMVYRYHYVCLEDHTNLTVIDPIDEDHLYIMLVQF